MIDQTKEDPEHRGAAPSRAQDSVGDSGAGAPLDLFEPVGPDPSDTFELSPIGEYLRRQRVLRGVSIEELSSITRIPLRSLERLEHGEFDGETDGFVRGFVRTVATAIGLDADDTISRMLKEPPVGVWERHQSGRRLKQAFAGVALLVTGIVAFLVLQAGWRLLVGSSVEDPGREVVVWRDPVRSLAEEIGVEVDPAGEIDPSRGTRLEPLSDRSRRPSSGRSRAASSAPAPSAFAQEP